MGESLEWLKKQVEKVEFDERLLRLYVSEDKYILGAHLKNNSGPNYFSISTIYDSIVRTNMYIRLSFCYAAECKPTENLSEHDMIGKPPANELMAIYYIENMIFRIETLWDLLAQLCNEFWKTGKKAEKIYFERYFREQKNPFAKTICNYFDEAEDIKEDAEFWYGNYKFVKDYRNKMTHRNSPSITTLSNFDFDFRPPTMFVLKRAAEVYIKVAEFINSLLKEIQTHFSDGNFFNERKP